MVKVTWLGEAASGATEMVWNNIKFEKDKPVEVENERMIEKAKNNRFFKVEGVETPKPKPEPSVPKPPAPPPEPRPAARAKGR